MKRSNSRKLKRVIIVCLSTILGVVIGLLGETVGNDLSARLAKNNIHPPTIYIIILVCTILTIIFLALDILSTRGENEDVELIAENIKPDVKRFFDSLKERYYKRYRSKLDGRFELTLEVSENFNSPNPQSITEPFYTNASEGRSIGVIQEAFEKKGRLLIVGSPGVGKTVLLLKLAIDLLDKIRDLEKEPLPVIFNLASWSPAYKNHFGDWLKEMLVSGYGCSKAFAETLLQQERIIFLLDGLDELARVEDLGELTRVELASEKRAECLDSLNAYLHNGRRAVISCRIEEFERMKEITEQEAPVSAKVEILKLSKAQVLNELEKAKVDTIDGIKHHTSATNLLKMLVTAGTDNLLEVLRTPFYFTIAMTVFDKEPRNEKELPKTIEEIRPKTIKEIKTYLIDKFVKRKLKDELTLNKSESEETTKWLNWLAELMTRRNRISFELVDLQPSDLTKSWYFGLFFGLVNVLWIGLSAGLIFGLVMGISDHDLGRGLFAGLLGFLYFGLGIGLLAWLVNVLGYKFGSPVDPTQDIIELDFSKLLQLNYWTSILGIGLGAGLASMLGIGLFGLWVGDLDFGLFGLWVGGLFGGLSTGLFVGFNKLKKTESVTYIRNPYQKIYGSFSVNAAFTLLIILLAASSLYVSINHVNNGVLVAISLTFLMMGIMFLLYNLFCEALFTHFCLRFCLYLEGKMPLKYAAFLDYAADLRILERDGGQWRFQHQKVQEYFAKLGKNN